MEAIHQRGAWHSESAVNTISGTILGFETFRLLGTSNRSGISSNNLYRTKSASAPKTTTGLMKSAEKKKEIISTRKVWADTRKIIALSEMVSDYASDYHAGRFRFFSNPSFTDNHSKLLKSRTLNKTYRL